MCETLDVQNDRHTERHRMAHRIPCFSLSFEVYQGANARNFTLSQRAHFFLFKPLLPYRSRRLSCGKRPDLAP